MASNKDADILTEIIQRLQGDEEAVFTKASGKLVLCEKTTNWYKQPGTREFKLRSDGKEGNTLFDSVNDKEPRSVWAQKKLRKCIQAWLQPTAEEREVFERREFVTDEDWEQRCLSNLFEENPDKKVLNTWCEDFLLQKEVSREELTAWLANKYVSWKRKRRLLCKPSPSPSRAARGYTELGQQHQTNA